MASRETTSIFAIMVGLGIISVYRQLTNGIQLFIIYQDIS